MAEIVEDGTDDGSKDGAKDGSKDGAKDGSEDDPEAEAVAETPKKLQLTTVSSSAWLKSTKNPSPGTNDGLSKSD